MPQTLSEPTTELIAEFAELRMAGRFAADLQRVGRFAYCLPTPSGWSVYEQI